MLIQSVVVCSEKFKSEIEQKNVIFPQNGKTHTTRTCTKHTDAASRSKTQITLNLFFVILFVSFFFFASPQKTEMHSLCVCIWSYIFYVFLSLHSISSFSLLVSDFVLFAAFLVFDIKRNETSERESVYKQK